MEPVESNESGMTWAVSWLKMKHPAALWTICRGFCCACWHYALPPVKHFELLSLERCYRCNTVLPINCQNWLCNLYLYRVSWLSVRGVFTAVWEKKGRRMLIQQKWDNIQCSDSVSHKQVEDSYYWECSWSLREWLWC